MLLITKQVSIHCLHHQLISQASIDSYIPQLCYNIFFRFLYLILHIDLLSFSLELLSVLNSVSYQLGIHHILLLLLFIIFMIKGLQGLVKKV